MNNDKIDEIIAAYEKLVLGIEKQALNNTDGRAYGGIIRAGKGKFVESIAKAITILAWEKLGQPIHRLRIEGIPIKINIKKEYIENLKHEEVKEYIKKNITKYFYRYKPDVLVLVDDKPVITIECKAYTENAMLKRILVDFTLVKYIYPSMVFVLFQLESQLGGDFSELKKIPFGSPSTHTLLSHFDIDLNIITLQKGERKIDRPIHKKEFYKPLTRESLENAIDVMSELFKKFI